LWFFKYFLLKYFKYLWTLVHDYLRSVPEFLLFTNCSNCWIHCKQIENTRYNHKHKYFLTSPEEEGLKSSKSNLCTCKCISSGETGTEIQSLMSTQFTLKSLTDLHGLLWIVWAQRIQSSLLLCNVEIYEMDLIVVSVRALRHIMIMWYQAFAKHCQRQNRKPPWNSPRH
jgi:hypothetical protein